MNINDPLATSYCLSETGLRDLISFYPNYARLGVNGIDGSLLGFSSGFRILGSLNYHGIYRDEINAFMCRPLVVTFFPDGTKPLILRFFSGVDVSKRAIANEPNGSLARQLDIALEDLSAGRLVERALVVEKLNRAQSLFDQWNRGENERWLRCAYAEPQAPEYLEWVLGDQE